MALEYFLYTELYNNTLIDRSHTTFAPLPADTGQILIDYLIPETQPLYLYKEDAGLIVANDDATVLAYLNGTAPQSQPQDPVFQETFTAYTGTTLTNINTRVYRSGDTMTGSLSTSGNLLASGAVTGSSVSASVLMTTPILNASTSISAPQITGSTCITTPISCATTLMQAPIVCGGTCVTSPITCGTASVRSPLVTGATVCAGTCLCSVGTTYLNGGVTAASFLNVSGTTKFNSAICWVNPTTGGTLNDYGVKWDPITKQLRTIATTGSSANVYCYASSAVTANNATDVNTDYISRTWSLSEGYYEAEFNAVFGNTSANRCATVCFLLNGAVVGSCNLMKTNDGTVSTTAYITQNNNLSGGTHTVQIVYRAIGGGIAQTHYGAMRIQKIGETIP